MEILGMPHKVVKRESVIVENDWAKSFMANLGFFKNELDIKKIVKSVVEKKNILEIINSLSEVKLRDKSGICIGARMGRPEKAKIRKLTGSPHVLFPIGEEGGRFRCFQSALELGKINAEFPYYYCDQCKKETIYPVCENCGKKSRRIEFCRTCNKEKENCPKSHDIVDYKRVDLDVKHYIEKAKKILNMKEIPSLVKGVRGTSNEDHTPENLAKGLLRAANNLFVNKDGTIRYDMTEMAITHFKPIEIGTSVEKLKKLGYKKDIYGEELVEESQILEINPQDIILPACEESDQEGADITLFRVSQFIDDLLKRFYKLDKFYNLKNKEELVGHLVIALAPHISAGIIGRIIGFSKTQGCYAHPYWHCAQRRDCDGDEDCVMLLMDALLNFSRKFLPSHRGGVQDAPLILTSHLISTEVDDMVFDMDCVWRYPLEFYEACEKYKMPWEIKIEKVGDRLGDEKQYEKLGFTHNVSSINAGVRCSAYKSLPTMMEKVRGQMELAEKIRAVDEVDVARLVIERHFIRDIKGNLRKFSMQQFRCVDCNEKYRRPPLIGKCLKCGGKIIFTISQGSIIK
jgi:DNA polymerase II large subunit